MAIALLFLAGAAVAAPGVLSVPLADKPVTIDGRLDDPVWAESAALPLTAAGIPGSLPAGGETRIVVRRGWLCLAARLPEPDRIVAVSRGRDPAWWREDLVAWRFRSRSPSGRNRSLVLAVNPLGALRVEAEPASDSAASDKQAVASVNVTSADWTVELAFPAASLGPLGLLSVERVRVPRPQAPELRWYWPEANHRAAFTLPAAAGAADPPGHRPPSPLSPDPQIASPKPAFPQMLERNLRARMAVAAEKEKQAWLQVHTRQDWERFRDQRLKALRDSLGPFPERTPLRAAVTRRADSGDGYVIENLVFESRPRLLVTANLYLPARIEGRLPAIVIVHSHHAPRFQSELQDMGMTWARSGTAVLVMDQLGAGERLQSNPWPRESYFSRYALNNQLYLAGESLMKWMAWDLMRGIDMLLERSYIDPKRIVMLGACAGGGDPAAVTAALDDRIAAVIPINFGEAGPEEHYLYLPRPYEPGTATPGWGSWEATRNLHRSAAGQFFPWLICASVAPRGFVYSFEIGWPKTVEEQPPWPRYSRVFEFYGRGDRLASADGFGPFPGPGEFANVGSFLRKRLYPILNRWLGIAVPAEEYHNVRPEADLAALTPALAAERRPRPASEIALEIARERYRRRPADLAAALRARLGDIEPNRAPAARALGLKDGVESFEIESEPGIAVRVLLARPADRSRPSPVVLGLSQHGKETFLTNRRKEIEKLAGSGVAVCLADVRGVGETAPSANRSPSGMGLAATELMLGNTMLGARLKDARTVFAWLAARPDIDRKRIALWGESFAAVNERIQADNSVGQTAGPPLRQAEPLGSLLALFTALYEKEAAAVVARGGLVSFFSVLEDRFAYVPQDIVVPGIIEAGDVPDIAAAIAPRPVLQAGLVDGRNRPVPPAGPAPANWLLERLR